MRIALVSFSILAAFQASAFNDKKADLTCRTTDVMDAGFIVEATRTSTAGEYDVRVTEINGWAGSKVTFEGVSQLTAVKSGTSCDHKLVDTKDGKSLVLKVADKGTLEKINGRDLLKTDGRALDSALAKMSCDIGAVVKKDKLAHLCVVH